MRRYLGISTSALVVALLAGATPAHALTINDVFDSSITSDPNHVNIENTITAASTAISSLYSNNLTISINFSEAAGVLGESDQYVVYPVTYARYTAALKADAAANAQNTTLAKAVANLPYGNGGSATTTPKLNMLLTTSQFDMLTPYGLPGPVNCTGATLGCPGGNIIVGNNTVPIYWGMGSVPDGEYSGTAVVSHEIDEILGGGGAGSTLNDTGAFPQGSYYGSTDLYRYSAPGTPSYTNSTTASSYYSIDGGATSLVVVNKTGGGSDYGDFAGSCPTGKPNPLNIQDAYGCPGHTYGPFAGSVEDTMLQSIGYDHYAPAPLPGAGLAGLGFFSFVAARRKLKDAAERLASRRS